jgi:hypothetical protein
MGNRGACSMSWIELLGLIAMFAFFGWLAWLDR